MDYKELSKAEKIEYIREMNFCRAERHDAAFYLKALWRADKVVTGEYESFGDRPHQFFLNKRTYDAGLRFGFAERRFNKYGWLENADFTAKEQIEFTTKDRPVASNYLTVGQGANGKWSYGASYSTGASGGGYGLGVWGEVFDTRKECLSAALQEILDRHRRTAELLKNDTCGNYNAKFSREIMCQVKDLLDETAGRKAIQLNLFQ